MILSDKQIKMRGDSLIKPFAPDHVQSICYDLSVESFCSSPENESDSVTIAPSDSVFVKTREEIMLPPDMIGFVNLRNSRIRQGLDLSAPVYQPGHHTKVFFRVTNISHKAITLDASSGIASIIFVVLPEEVEKPYDGAFQKEFDFKGMGAYTSSLSKQMTDIAKKVSDVKEIEKSIYGNVLALMAIFVAIFSLVNVNVSLVTQNVSTKTLLTMNFATISSIGFLIAIVNTVLSSGRHRVAIWIICAIAFLVTIATHIFL